MLVAASLPETVTPESTGGGDGACDEVQAVQAERSAEMHLQCATDVDAGALEDPSDVEFEWRTKERSSLRRIETITLHFETVRDESSAKR